MANKKIVDFTLLTAPASGDLVETVDISDTTDAASGSSKQVTHANVITKAHGLSDGVVKVSSGVMVSDASGLDVADGGTGSTTAGGARTNLGAVNLAGDTMTGQLSFSGAGHAGLKLNSLTTTQRDLLTPAEGMLIYNSTSSTVQKYQGGTWSDVTASTSGDFSSNTSTSVDSEIVLFSGTGGKTGKRATTTGILKGTSGVLSAATAGTDYYNPGGTDVAVADGGTGASTATAGFDALSPMTTAGDLIYGGASGTRTRLGIGTGLQQLRTNAGATAPEWFTPSASGGQTTYDAIVAPSGGDYTTLGAALAAASNGWRIFVKAGTYSESAISSSLTNLHIVGATRETAILSMGANAFTLSGVGVVVEHLNFTSTTGVITFSGNDAKILHCRAIHSDLTTSGSWVVSGARPVIDGLYYELSDLDTVNADKFRLNSSTDAVLTNSHFKTNSIGNGAAVRCGTRTVISNVVFERFGASSEGAGRVVLADNNSSVIGCRFSGWTGATTCLVRLVTGSRVEGCHLPSSLQCVAITGENSTVTGSYIAPASGGIGVDISASNNVVTGNYMLFTSTGTAITLQTTVTNTVITGNRLQGFTTGVTITDSACTATIITGNQFEACTTPISDAGVGTQSFNNTGTSVIFEKRYLYMKNTSGSTINPGNVVTLKAVAAGNEVTTTTTASDNLVLGVATASIANNASGFIQVAGKTTLLTVNGTTDIAVGDFLTTYTAAGIAKKATAATLGVTLGDLAFAIALEAYTTDDSSGVIDALIITPRRL